MPRSLPAPLPRALPSRRTSSPLYKAAACVLRGAATATPPEKIAKSLYAGDDNVAAVIKAASTQADLTTPDWAGVLAHDVIASELIQRLTALSAAANLMQRGLRVDLTGKGSITIPGRSFNPQTAGGWIAEGQPIPLRQPPIIPGPKLAPRTLAVLATFTSEMVMADSILEFTTAAITEAAAALLDQELFSTNAASAAAPGGILAGAQSVPPSSASAVWAISSDVGALVEALANAGGGLEPVIVAAPAQAAALRMWRQETFYDIYPSLALPAGTVCAVESSSLVSGLEGIPTFSTSTGATIHMEDTAPTDITGGTPSPATPVKSMFQTDVIALKMILRASWGMRNPAHVAVVSSVTW
jgi:Phage capsid family